jgi:hypothetical protein
VEQIPARVEERPVNGGAGGTVIDLTSDTQMKKKKKKKKKKTGWRGEVKHPK